MRGIRLLRGSGVLLGAAALTLVIGGWVQESPDGPKVAGHGSTCSDGLDNDRDGRADDTDLNDCFDFQDPGTGRPPDHDEDNTLPPQEGHALG